MGCTVSRVLENSGFPVQNNARNSQLSSRPDKPATESAARKSPARRGPGVTAMIERWSSLHTPTTMCHRQAHARSAATSYLTHSQHPEYHSMCVSQPVNVCSRRRNRLHNLPSLPASCSRQAATHGACSGRRPAAGVFHHTARCGACGRIGRGCTHTHNVRHPTAHTPPPPQNQAALHLGENLIAAS